MLASELAKELLRYGDLPVQVVVEEQQQTVATATNGMQVLLGATPDGARVVQVVADDAEAA